MPKTAYKWFPTSIENVSVTCAGLVRSGKNLIKIHHLPNGQLMVKLTVGGIRDFYPVDELVALAFLGKPPRNPYLPGKWYRVAHKNGDVSDCRIDNLFWVPDPDRQRAYYMALMRDPYRKIRVT